MRPAATYRLQFRDGMTFDRAAEQVPYLERLGVSHLYASPISTAASGSTHGYDVTDHNSFDPALGGEAGFTLLSDTLKQHGLGLILDIVPNHMAASAENPWFADVLEWGEQSRYAHHFDIDWTAGYVTLPFLGKPFGACLTDGEFSLDTKESGRIVLKYYENYWPLHPRSIPLILDRLGGDFAFDQTIADASAADFTDTMAHLVAEADLRDRLQSVARDPDLIRDLHEIQAWRLFEWREGRRHLTYRRFFEITGLIGVRVEDEAVFDDVHRLTLDLVKSGRVDGLRIDHVDGLTDPTNYLKRLRQAVGPDVPIYVEKILEPGERLPPDWPVEGTTGYEFIAAVAESFTDETKAEGLDRTYREALDAALGYETELQAAKTEIVTWNLEGELDLLAQEATVLARTLSAKDADEEDLREALVDLMAAFPVYRTYVNADGLPAGDAALLDRIESGFDVSGTIDKFPKGLDFLFRLLRLQVPDELRDEALAFVTRFQQTTGPVMAKAVEDTLFFRFNRLIALNEVGGDPQAAPGGAAAFHIAMRERLEAEPQALTATATHDTKRGEDARARLYTLSEAPDTWAEAVGRWRAMHADLVEQLPNGAAPEPETEWMLYQALLGAWPMDVTDNWLGPFKERFLIFVEKAMREDKRRTRWTEIDETYEAAVRAYASRLVDPENRAFVDDFTKTARPFITAGAINSLSQTLLKLTAPGIPDIYNGSEAWDFSFVDPDNRRPVDFARLAATLNSPASWPPTSEHWRSGAVKQHLVASVLRLRAEHPALFAEGSYEPVEASGPKADHLIAFLRRHNDRTALVVVPRLPLDLLDPSQRLEFASGIWSGTRFTLDLPGARFRHVLTGAGPAGIDPTDPATLLEMAPVGIFIDATD